MIRALQPPGLCLYLCPWCLHLLMLWMQVSRCQQHAGIDAVWRLEPFFLRCSARASARHTDRLLIYDESPQGSHA
jgi:hypothetical protein